MDKTNPTLTTALILTLALITMSSCEHTAPESTDTIQWGFIAPLTGTASIYGVPALNAAQIAVDEINAAGGIDGKKLELIVEDGKCDGPTSVTAAHKLIDTDNVDVIIGGHCSTESLSIVPITQSAGVFQLAGTTSTPGYTGKGRYALRTTSSAASYAKAQADVAWKQGYRRVASLAEQKDFPQGVVDAFSKRFIELGGSMVARETFAPGATDFRTELAKLDAVQADALLISTNGADSSSLVFKQLKELGIDTIVMGNPINIGPATWKLSDGAMPDTAWAVTPHTEPDANGITARFVEKYTSLHGSIPLELALVAENYDGIHIMADAVGTCGDDNECIRGHFLLIQNYTGAAGTISYGTDGDPLFTLAVMRIEDGKAVYEKI